MGEGRQDGALDTQMTVDEEPTAGVSEMENSRELDMLKNAFIRLQQKSVAGTTKQVKTMVKVRACSLA
jgi:hypothetical protein